VQLWSALSAKTQLKSVAIGGQSGKKTFVEEVIDHCKSSVPLAQNLCNDDVGNAGLFLCGSMAHCVTGVALHLNDGLHSMGMSLDSLTIKLAAAGAKLGNKVALLLQCIFPCSS